jgi:prepilin-type N-terminal cleavage/methylation domain-containing protein
MKNKGFTLIELVVTIGILAVVLSTAMVSFYQSLKSGAKTERSLNQDGEVEIVLKMMERGVIYSQLNEVEGVSRAGCLQNSGLAEGNTMKVSDKYGQTTYAISDIYLASNSARLTSDGVKIDSLNFVWDCSGAWDEVTIEMTVQSKDGSGNWGFDKSYKQSWVLRNSGSFVL